MSVPFHGYKKGFVSLKDTLESATFPPYLIDGKSSDWESIEDLARFYCDLASDFRLQRTVVSEPRPEWRPERKGVRVIYPYNPALTDEKSLTPTKGVSLYDGVEENRRYLVSYEDDHELLEPEVTIHNWKFGVVRLNLGNIRGSLLRFDMRQLLVRKAAIEGVYHAQLNEEIHAEGNPLIWFSAKDKTIAEDDPVFERLLYPYKY